VKIERVTAELQHAISKSRGQEKALARTEDLGRRRSMVALKNNRGFSLVETMTVIGIVAIMGTFAVPPLISWLQNKGLNSAARDMYSNFRKAQSIAVKNNRNCAISFDGTQGYMVFVDEDKDYTYDPTAVPPKKADTIIAQVLWSQYRNVKLAEVAKPVTFADNDESSPKPTVAFRPNLIPSKSDGSIGNGSVKLQNSNSRRADIAISVSGNISLKWY